MKQVSSRRIDIHAHYYPQTYLKLIATEGIRFGARCEQTEKGPLVEVSGLRAGPLARRFVDLDARVADMNSAGIDVQVLSLTQPMVYWADGEMSQRLSETFNDAVQAAHERYPERLFGFATLPMTDPDRAVTEIDRVATMSGIRGLYLGTRVLATELSEESLFPVYERAQSYGLPIFLHPLNVIDAARLEPYFLSNLLGNPFDTAVAAAHLIFGGVLDRFPDLQICLPHAGGAFPYLVGRLQHGWSVRPELKHRPRGPLEYLQRFTYDTISHSASALRYLIHIVGADRVMLGSDYCFDMGCERPVEAVMACDGLSAHDQERVLGGNAATLLKL